MWSSVGLYDLEDKSTTIILNLWTMHPVTWGHIPKTWIFIYVLISVDELYSLQKDGEYLKLPSVYRAKIDSNIILEQLQIYRDQGLAPESEIQSAEREKLETGDKKPIAMGSSNEINQGPDKRKGFAYRLAKAGPYNFFLTAIRDSPPTHKEVLSIRFHELLDPSLGDLDSSLQINFMVEMDWLLEMYKVYGHE